MKMKSLALVFIAVSLSTTTFAGSDHNVKIRIIHRYLGENAVFETLTRFLSLNSIPCFLEEDKLSWDEDAGAYLGNIICKGIDKVGLEGQIGIPVRYVRNVTTYKTEKIQAVFRFTNVDTFRTKKFTFNFRRQGF